MSKTTRRSFIRTSGTAVAASTAFPLFSIGKEGESPNSKINAAVVGVAGMGGYALGEASRQNLVAMCDLDESRAGGAFKKFADVPKYKDFRVMMDKMHKDIDAVSISTPDHIHFPAAMAAMERGKHVFIQKPLAHNVWQVRTLRKAAKKYKVQTQMGNQGHTFDGMYRIKEWVGGGAIGEVKEVITWTNRPNAPWFVPPPEFPPKPAEVPATLDWDLWQGPTEPRPYSPHYCPVKWRGWWDYGCGGLGDIGCHTLDAPFSVLKLGMPTKVEVERKEPPGPGFIPMGSVVTYHFAARGNLPPVTMKWFEKGYEVPKPKRWDQSKPLPAGGGMYMEGTKETLYHSGMRPGSPQVTPNERFMEVKGELNKIPKMEKLGKHPIDEFYKAIKGDIKEPQSNFDYAARLTEVVLLGALAQRTGVSFEWDEKAMKVKGHPEFDKYLKEPAREGWRFGEDLV